MEKRYDLEQRTEEFAKAVIVACKKLPKNTINLELVSQEIRSAGSVGANYIEANEALSKKDFANRIKICGKEAKESGYWLRLISSTNYVNDNQIVNLELNEEILQLIQESTELMNIFGAILRKTENQV